MIHHRAVSDFRLLLKEYGLQGGRRMQCICHCMQPAYLFGVHRNYNKTGVVRHLQVKAKLQKKQESAEAGKGTVAKE